MAEYFLVQGELLLRLIAACVCGVLIGYERQNRLKVAGVRTHLIVALAAALIMIVSKYGFQDLLGMNGIGLDPSRIAAQVVSGVGFLGAGIIFVRKREISGLTTAAGIWATAGVGMALGAGMYLIGIAAAGLIILVQIILHKDFRLVPSVVGERIFFELEEGEETLAYIHAELRREKIDILNIKAKKAKNGNMSVELYLRLSKPEELHRLVEIFNSKPHIISIEF